MDQEEPQVNVQPGWNWYRVVNKLFLSLVYWLSNWSIFHLRHHHKTDPASTKAISISCKTRLRNKSIMNYYQWRLISSFTWAWSWSTCRNTYKLLISSNSFFLQSNFYMSAKNFQKCGYASMPSYCILTVPTFKSWAQHSVTITSRSTTIWKSSFSNSHLFPPTLTSHHTFIAWLMCFDLNQSYISQVLYTLNGICCCFGRH